MLGWEVAEYMCVCALHLISLSSCGIFGWDEKTRWIF